MVRLADIAKRAGVSQGTVSAVLSGGTKGNIRVSPEKRERILAIAKEMKYIPNFSAQKLSGQSSHTIGVLVDSEDAAVRFRQLAAIEREADRRGYRILVAETHDNPEKLLLACRTLFQYGVDAVVSPANDASEELKKLGRIVFYGGEAVDGYPSVYSDIASGYAEAAAQFACEKRKNPALLLAENYEAYDTLRARRSAFLSLFPALEANILSLPPLPDSTEEKRRIFASIAEQVIARGFDALLLQNDFCALSLCSELLRRGKKIPEEISLVGQDNAEFCSCVYPALSTIDSNLELFAEAVVELALERMRNPESLVRSIAVPAKLIKRESTQTIRGENTGEEERWKRKKQNARH